MTSKAASSSSVVLTVLLAMMALGAWWWQTSILDMKRIEVRGEPWQRVKEAYPMPQESPAPPTLSTETVDALLQANPFSPQRRPLPAHGSEGEHPGGTEGASSEVPPIPHFVYKGRIDVGKRQRAIVEDTTTHKTYFLEEGQEVAGFKVLDIAENRVVLSNLRTGEEVVASLSSGAKPASQPQGGGGVSAPRPVSEGEARPAGSP